MTEPAAEPTVTREVRWVAELIRTLGFSTVVSCALLYGFYIFGTDMLESHRKFIDAVAASQAKTAEAVVLMERTQSEQLRLLTQLSEGQKRIIETISPTSRGLGGQPKPPG